VTKDVGRAPTAGASIVVVALLLLAGSCGGQPKGSPVQTAMTVATTTVSTSATIASSSNTTTPATSAAPETTATPASLPTGPCAGSGQPAGSAGQAFHARWSDRFDGSVASTDVTATVIYVACEKGPSKSIAAVSTTDGSTLWVTTVTPNGDWNGQFAVAATSAGPLTSYQDDAGAHLVLLDAGSGRAMWARPINEPAYDLLGEVTSGLGAVDLTENDEELVDLASGQLQPADTAFFTADGQYVTVDGATLNIGGNPFDTAVPGTTVALTAEPNDVTGADDLIVAAEGDDVVGVTGGRERWRVAAGVGAIGTVGLLGRYVLAEGESTDPSDPSAVGVIALDPTPRLAGQLPQFFDTNSMAGFELDPSPVVVGIVDPTPGGASNDEVDQLVAVALTAGGPTVVRSIPVNALSLLSATPTDDRYVWIDDGHLHALSVPDLHDDADINVGTNATTTSSGRGILLVDDHTLTWFA
jgi:hypothetical protein